MFYSLSICTYTCIHTVMQNFFRKFKSSYLVLIICLVNLAREELLIWTESTLSFLQTKSILFSPIDLFFFLYVLFLVMVSPLPKVWITLNISSNSLVQTELYHWKISSLSSPLCLCSPSSGCHGASTCPLSHVWITS